MKYLPAILFLFNFIWSAGQDYPLHAPDNSLLDDGDMARNLEEAFTFTRYPTHEQYIQMMLEMSASYQAICTVDTIGFSVLGRPILVLRITNDAENPDEKPGFFYTSSMHGDELVGYILLLRLADFLLKNYGSDTEVDRLLDNLEIFINPLSNPDGMYKYSDTTVLNAWRFNIQGTGDAYDINRNFPDPSKNEPDDTTGRLTETKAMMTFLQKKRFNLSANIHSGEEVVNYPWDYTSQRHPDDAWYRFISREYADEARAVNPDYMRDFTDGITNGWEWYQILGGRQDYVNYYLGGREVTLELAKIKMPDSDFLDHYWITNERSLINYMSQALYGIHGKVTSAVSGLPLVADITIPDHDQNFSRVSSDGIKGNFFRYINEGTYDLVISAEGFVNDTVYNVEVEDYRTVRLNIMLDSITDPNAIDKGLINRVNDVKIFPNPAGEFIVIQLESPGNLFFRYHICNVEGNTVLTGTTYQHDPVFKIDISSLTPGLYYLRIESESAISGNKFIKQ